MHKDTQQNLNIAELSTPTYVMGRTATAKCTKVRALLSENRDGAKATHVCNHLLACNECFIWALENLPSIQTKGWFKLWQ